MQECTAIELEGRQKGAAAVRHREPCPSLRSPREGLPYIRVFKGSHQAFLCGPLLCLSVLSLSLLLLLPFFLLCLILHFLLFLLFHLLLLLLPFFLLCSYPKISCLFKSLPLQTSLNPLPFIDKVAMCYLVTTLTFLLQNLHANFSHDHHTIKP